jgi:hypothetical protein
VAVPHDVETATWVGSRERVGRENAPLDAPSGASHFYRIMATCLIIDHRIDRPLHPEKAHRPDNPIQRESAWIRVKTPSHPIYHEKRSLLRANGHGKLSLPGRHATRRTSRSAMVGTSDDRISARPCRG